MLNWICPECGRENDPLLRECAGCADPPAAPRVSSPRTRRSSPQPDAPPARAREVAVPKPPPSRMEEWAGAAEFALGTVQPSIPELAATSVRHQPELAAKVPLLLPAYWDSDGPALSAMLRAVNTDPKLLAPALEPVEDAPSEEDALPVSHELCGRISQRATVRPVESCRIIVRLRIRPERRRPRKAIPEAPLVTAAPAWQPATQLFRISPPHQVHCPAGHPRAFATPAVTSPQIAIPACGTKQGSFAPAPLCSSVPMPAPVLEPQAAPGALAFLEPMERMAAPALPSALRNFQEGVVPRIPYMKRPATGETAPVLERRGVPAWAITIGTAIGVLLVALFAVQRFTARSDVHAANTTAAAVSVPAAAYGAWPSLDQFVEVAGLRLTTDQKRNSDAVFTLVNHSASDVGAMGVKITVPGAKAGDPPLCDISVNVEPLGPWEAREVRAPLERELHAAELPDWRETHPHVVITSTH